MSHLAGVRVLELGNFISGPYAGQLLAEMGAEVIKVERPQGGDPFRSFDGTQLSPQFCAYNRGKRSVTIDINTSAGRNVLLKLAEGADVLLENFRPGVLDRLGLGWEVLQQKNPRLIYCSISGFGPDGPYADRPAYDTVAQSMSGFFSQLLDPERPRIAGPAMADAISGLYAALGIAAALAGRGQGRSRPSAGSGHGRSNGGFCHGTFRRVFRDWPSSWSLRPRRRLAILRLALRRRPHDRAPFIVAEEVLGVATCGHRKPRPRPRPAFFQPGRAGRQLPGAV